MPEIPLSLIDEWEHNRDLRIAKDESVEEIDESLKLGQIASFLVRPTEEGRFKSLGGNNRIRRMRTLNYDSAECEILEFEQDEQGFYPVINGKAYRNPDGSIPKHFESILEGEMALAFVHNNRFAFYRKDGVANMTGNFPNINWKGINVDFKEPINMGMFKSQFENPPPLKEKNPVDVTCPNCQFVFDAREHKLDVKDKS